MRLFIAAHIPERTRDRIYGCAGMLRGSGAKGNITPPDNYHFTLAFIGETDRADEICRTVSGIETPSFRLDFGYFGRFGDTEWISPYNTDELVSLSLGIRNELKKLGIRFDPKPPKPHVTIMRKAVRPEGFEPPKIEKFSYSVRRIYVMSSVLGGPSPVYKELCGKDLL